MSPLSDLRTSPSAETFAFGLLKDLMLVVAMPLPAGEERIKAKKKENNVGYDRGSIRKKNLWQFSSASPGVCYARYSGV